MRVVPCVPLVTATGLSRSSGKSRCSMEAKNAFMSTCRMARGQGSDMGSARYGDTVYSYSLGESLSNPQENTVLLATARSSGLMTAIGKSRSQKGNPMRILYIAALAAGLVCLSTAQADTPPKAQSEEHTSELQSL